MLKGDMLSLLLKAKAKMSGGAKAIINSEVWSQIKGIDLSGPLGAIGYTFDTVKSEIPKEVLITLESECRKNDKQLQNPKYTDLPWITRPTP